MQPNNNDFKKLDKARWYKEGDFIYADIRTMNLNIACGLCLKEGILRIENIMIDEQTSEPAIFKRNNPIVLCDDCTQKISKGGVSEILASLVKRELNNG